MMQVDNIIIVLLPLILASSVPSYGPAHGVYRYKDCVQQRNEKIFDKKMNFRIRHLFFQAADDWCGKNNIADGRKTYDEKFKH